MNPLIVIDSGHIVTTIANCTRKQSGVKVIRKLIDGEVGGLVTGLKSETDCEVAIACDSKPYVTNLLVPGYKGNRPPNPQRKRVLDEIKKRADAYSLPGLEADQVAGVLVKFHAGHRPIRLLTVDTDWYQLRSDKLDVVVVDLYHKRWLHHHTDPSVCKYYQNKVPKRSDFELQSPKCIAKFKVLFGDGTDKLPVGSPDLASNLLY